ncbi:MAG: hypothetical protein ABR929_09890 [Roseiarcus sp.]
MKKRGFVGLSKGEKVKSAAEIAKEFVSSTGLVPMPFLNKALDKAFELIFKKGQVSGHLSWILFGDTKFLNQDSTRSLQLYKNETPIAEFLPYLEIVNWLDATREKTLVLFPRHLEFEVGKWGGSGDEIVYHGYREFGVEHGSRENRKLIRVDSIEIENDSVILNVRPSRYSEQMKSNLILDYEFGEQDSGNSLRKILLSEHPGKLPSLDDPRLANTLGVATLLIYRQYGADIPHLVVRGQKVAVFNAGSAWHCSSSYAAKWVDDELVGPTGFREAIEPYLYIQLREEIGLEKGEVFGVRPIALCREMIRGGKPQLFCLAYTSLEFNVLKERLLIARKEEYRRAKEANSEFRPEVEAMPYFRDVPETSSEEFLVKILESHEITPEGAALCWYWHQSRKRN